MCTTPDITQEAAPWVVCWYVCSFALLRCVGVHIDADTDALLLNCNACILFRGSATHCCTRFRHIARMRTPIRALLEYEWSRLLLNCKLMRFEHSAA